MSLASGSTFGPYRVIEPLGRGGMAAVYRAYEAALDRYVALKVLPAEFLHDPTFAERFRREAKVVARLEHPNIIPIYSFDIENGMPWMAMRLIGGGTLAGLMKGSRLSTERCAAIVRGVAAALDYAHGKGVMHRDIKPQNILLDEAQRVYLADFGIARMVEGATALTQTGMITGTPQYMAPEQATGTGVDHRADIYALGIVTYEMLTGRVPFSADTPVAILLKHVSDPMPLPPLCDVPEPVVRAVLKCTAKKPDDRWATAAAFADALDQGLREMETAPVPRPVAPTEVVRATAPLVVPPPTAPAGPAVSIRRTEAVSAPAALTPPPRPPVGAARPMADTERPIERPAARGGKAGLIVAAVAGVLVLGLVAVVVILRQASAPTKVAPALSASPGEPLADQSPNAGGPSREASPSEERLPEKVAELGTAQTAPTHAPEGSATLEAPAPSTRAAHKPASGPLGSRPAATAAENPEPAPAPPREPAPNGVLHLDVDAAQDPFSKNAVGALYMQVRVDDRLVREMTLPFDGKDAFTRSRTRKQFDLAGVPGGRRRVTVTVAAEAGFSAAAHGSTEVSIEPEGTRLTVQVRERTNGEREVRFR